MTASLKPEVADPGRADRSLAQALRGYFDENGFGEDGGYSSAWVDFHLGPIPMPFPNTAARKRAVPFHDLHHIVTGYRTNVAGEFEISAWEIGSGCRDFVAAWQLNLGGLAGGVMRWPVRTFRAFVRGRHSKNLYGRSYDAALLASSIADARRELGLDREPPPGTKTDVLLFVLAYLAGAMVGLVTMAVVVPLAIVAAPVLAYLRRAHERRQAAGPRTSPELG
jgi:hypothetical protein